MRTAAGILKMLREGAGPVSGGRMASRLGLTRAAVWKAVQSLRDQGFDIQGVPNQGYTLLGETDRLSAPAIGSPGLPVVIPSHPSWLTIPSVGATDAESRPGVFDSPPAVMLTDATVLAAKLDRVVELHEGKLREVARDGL